MQVSSLQRLVVVALLFLGFTHRAAPAGEPDGPATRLVVEANGGSASGARVAAHLGYVWQPTSERAGRAVRVASHGRVETASSEGRVRLPPPNASVPALPRGGLVGVSADGSQVGLWSASEVYSPGSEPLRLGPPAFVEVRIRVADAGQGLPSARPLAAHITRIDPDGPGVDVMLGVSGFLHGSWMYSAGAPPGTYELSFGLATYAPVSKQRIELVEGTTTRVTLESPQAALAGHVGRTLPPMRGLASGEPLAGGPTSTGWVRGERDFTVLLFREQWRDESIDDYERTLRDLRDAAKLPAEDRARLRLVLIEARHPALLVRVRDGLQAEEDGAQVPEIVADEDAAYRKVIGVPEGRWSILLDGRGVVIGVSADWYAADAGRSLLDEERAFLRGMARGEDEDGLVADIPWVYLGPHVREWAGKAALGVAGVLNQVQAAK